MPVVRQREAARRDLANLRKWWVKDFDNHLIFYMPCPDGVSIVRVLHAASDWWALLGFEG
ncbi:MAG: type II toxin-antitoxin system RelE/ParE family toxin [Burkholderiales bacterium]|nr:type II toxin-antitoxin system RelE/ParE family toxin [Burkholderiales bacterium]